MTSHRQCRAMVESPGGWRAKRHQCRLRPLPGSDWCRVHDPEVEKRRAEATQNRAVARMAEERERATAKAKAIHNYPRVVAVLRRIAAEDPSSKMSAEARQVLVEIGEWEST